MGKPIWERKVVRFLAGFLIILPAWVGFVELFKADVLWVLYGLGIVWAADSGAYFVGKWKGKTFLAPAISPKKTWEGVLGGFACVTVLALLFFTWLDWPWINLVLLSLLLGAFSIVGDLTESILKRVANVKDSGTLLPGHGGILDRIDSLLAVFPILAWIITR